MRSRKTWITKRIVDRHNFEML